MNRFVLAAAAVALLAFSSSSRAADPAVKCESGKLKESSKYSACRLKADAKGVSKGEPADYTKCELKFAAKWATAEAKAGPGICPSEGDQVSMDARITTDAAEIATLLAGGALPACGDASVDAGEQCDSGDLAGADCTTLGFTGGALACDGSCFFDLSGCTAGGALPACGDASIDAGEQCDGVNLAGADCTTRGFTGGVLACDGSCFFDPSGCTGYVGGLIPGTDPILPASGQTTAYGAGSDGDVQAGRALSYTDNGDGTITDNNTGLMWEKKDDSGGIHDKDNTYSWSIGAPYNMNGTMVTTFLATLNGGGGFAGYTDWRIPNYKELTSILDLEVISPSVDPAFHQSATCTGCTDVTLATCSCTVSSSYWSSTTIATNPGYAWYVHFVYGDVSNVFKTLGNRVRAVRGGL